MKMRLRDLANYMQRYDYCDIFIICAKHGHVMYSAAAQSDFGTNLVHGPYRESGLPPPARLPARWP
ncbi:MAG: hypothetical protein ACOY32_00410 [Thermodesulfobacteriota bacterium]